MRLILPVLLLVVGLGAGVGAGLFLGASSSPEAGAEVAEDADSADSAQAEDDGSLPLPPGDGVFVTPASDQTEYVRLENQFVVPVVRDGTVRSLVIMVLTVEVGLGRSETVFLHEPRLRDSFLRVLFAHANAGGFDGTFTDAVSIEPLRRGLRNAAVSVLGDSVRDVLIVDITRQDA
ncbi:MAG: flagellar basal body-associated FliL family protein [Roseicyclus sp.]